MHSKVNEANPNLKFRNRQRHFNDESLKPITTGMRVNLYVSDRQASHAPRVKCAAVPGKSIDNKTDAFYYYDHHQWIQKNPGKVRPKDLDDLELFLKLNTDILLRLWLDKDYSFNQFKASVQKIPRKRRDTAESLRVLLHKRRIIVRYLDALIAYHLRLRQLRMKLKAYCSVS